MSHRYRSRSIIEWWAQNTGSSAAIGTADIAPPTQPCTPLWMLSRSVLNR